MRHYLDTSALVKLLVAETGSDDMAMAVEISDRLHTCRIAYPEARAAIAAMERASRLDRAGVRTARFVLEWVWARVSVQEVTATLATAAGDLAEQWSLRGFDAVHLAAALDVATDDLIMATWDLRLSRAAQGAGLRVLSVGSPGA